MGITRRSFLKFSGGGVAALVGAGLVSNGILSHQSGPVAAVSAGPDITYRHGVCGICEMSCAFTGRIENGRLAKLEGKPADQHSRGSLCAKGNAGINMLYDPDRLKAPMLKTIPGRIPGQDPRWQKLDWDEAIARAAAEIQKAIDNYGPQSVMWIGHGAGQDFLRAIGSPNDIKHLSTCNAVRMLASQLCLGEVNYVPDFEHSQYILAFGWDQLGKGKNSFARGPIIAVNDNAAKMVVFDPRLSTTATKANEWIPIRPGTDLAVVLAMLNVVVTEKRYKADYVAANVAGFDELAAEVVKYTPEWAAAISDVPADTIRRIAREFSGGCPALIPIHKREAIQARPGGFELVRACLSLMAITGNIERQGGIMLPRTGGLNWVGPAAEAPPIKVTERVDGGHLFPLAVKEPLVGTGLYQSVADMILADEPYPVKVAIIYYQSLQSMPNPQKWAQALAKLDYVININIYPDDIATMADLVLPEHTYLERYDISPRQTNARYVQVALAEPMIEPLYDTRDLGEIKHLIARQLGMEQYLTPIGKAILDYRIAPSGMDFDTALAHGGLITGDKGFVPKPLDQLGTESRKLQLFSPKLQSMGYNPLPFFDEKWVQLPQENDEFYIVTNRPPVHRHVKTHNMKWLNEIMPEGYVQINATRAASLGIADGDIIELSTEFGTGRCKAKLTQGIRPDTLCILHGFGQKSPFLKLVQKDGMNDGDIMPAWPKEKNIELKDPVGASLDCFMTVKVRRVG